MFQLGKLRPEKLNDLLKITERVSELGFEPRMLPSETLDLTILL